MPRPSGRQGGTKVLRSLSLPRIGDGAQLLHHAHHVPVSPALDDPALGNAVDGFPGPAGEANLVRANLARAVLAEAGLMSANLESASLVRAILSRADLSGADLSEAILVGATLSGADLSTAGLTQEELEPATGDENTRLPPDLKPPAHWNVKTDEQNEGN